MASYNVTTPQGASYRIDADSDAQAQTAISSILSQSPTHSLKDFSTKILPDLGKNILGVGETMKQGLYDIPKAVAETPAQVLQGVPLGKTGLGQQAKQLRDQIPGIIADVKENASNPAEYAYQHPVTQALNVMALGGLAGEGLGFAGKELMELPRTFTAPAKPEILDVAKEHGIKLAAGDITGSSTQKSVENLASKFPFSSNVFKERYAQNNAAVRSMADKFVGDARLPEELGPAVKESFVKGSQDAKQVQEEAYAKPAAVAKEPIPLQKTMGIAKSLVDEQQKLPTAQQNTGLVNILKGYTQGEQFPQGSPEAYVMEIYGGASQAAKEQMLRDPYQASVIKRSQMPTQDYNTVQSIMSDLKDRIRTADTAQKSGAFGAAGKSSLEAGVYKRLLSGITQDLNEYSNKTGGQFKQLLDKANESYSIFKQNYGDNDYLNHFYGEQNPVKAFNKAIEPDNPVAVRTLRSNLTPQLQDEVQRATIRQMGEKSPGVFSQKQYVDNYEKFGEPNLRRFFYGENFDKARQLYVASKATLDAEANASAGVGKGFGSVIGLASPIYSVLRGAAGRGGAMVGGEAGLLPRAAEGYLSEPMTQALTQQPVTTMPKTMAAIQKAKGIGQSVKEASGGAAVERTLANLGNKGNPSDQQRVNELIERLKRKYERRRQM